MSKTRVDLPLSELTAISPLDGRYRSRLAELAPYFSEYNLIRTRFEIEAKYLIALSQVGPVRKLNRHEQRFLESLGDKITLDQAQRVKEIEEETRHDVKALERAFREMVKGTTLSDLTEMIHFGLTSEDVNNLAYRLMLTRATNDVIIPTLETFLSELVQRVKKFKKIPMLARTHGQAAVPTTVGKELAIFLTRLNNQVGKLKDYKFSGKLTGAVGNFNALHLAYPNVDWLKFSSDFVRDFGFKPNLVTTQINPYEDVIEYFQNYQRINGVIIDFAQDMWRYISDEWFVQEVKSGEVGSSTMPQKVNPIDFENCEGNLILANGIFETLGRKLAISRLQRDLSDSTTIRNIGVAVGHSLLGYKSANAGLGRARPNIDKIAKDLNRDFSILTEGLQTTLRKLKVADPYSLIAQMTRGEYLDQSKWRKLIDSLPIKSQEKTHLKDLTPSTYLGLAFDLTQKAINQVKFSKKK